MDWKNIDWSTLLAKSGEMPRNIDKAEVALLSIKSHLIDAQKVLVKVDGAVDDGLNLLEGLKATMKSVGDLTPFVNSIFGALNKGK